MINLKMKRYDMSITVECDINGNVYDNTMVNTAGILTRIESLLSDLDLFDIVNVSIQKNVDSVSEDSALESDYDAAYGPSILGQ